MVSSLNSRILSLQKIDVKVNGRNINGSRGGFSGSVEKSQSMITARLVGGGLSGAKKTPRTSRKKKRISGYSADQESLSSPLRLSEPVSAGTNEQNNFMDKNRRAEEFQERFKRRKVAEIQYAASTVHEDLEKAGRKVIKPGNITCSTLPVSLRSNINNHVQLVVDNGGNSEIDPCAKFSQNNVNPMVQHDIMTNFGRVYDAMVKSSSSFYQPANGKEIPSPSPPPPPSPFIFGEKMLASSRGSSGGSSVYTESSASSDTSDDDVPTESKNEALAKVLAITARLEDSIENVRNKPMTSTVSPTQNRKECREQAVGSPNNIMDVISSRCSSSLPMSLEEALSYSSKARLVIQSKHPLKIIHSNAAFTRSTGAESSSIMGRPLSNVISCSIQEDQMQHRESLSKNTGSSRHHCSTDSVKVLIEVTSDERQSLNVRSESTGKSSSFKIQFQMCIFPIMSDELSIESSKENMMSNVPHSDVNITHYCLEFSECHHHHEYRDCIRDVVVETRSKKDDANVKNADFGGGSEGDDEGEEEEMDEWEQRYLKTIG